MERQRGAEAVHAHAEPGERRGDREHARAVVAGDAAGQPWLQEDDAAKVWEAGTTNNREI